MSLGKKLETKQDLPKNFSQEYMAEVLQISPENIF